MEITEVIDSLFLLILYPPFDHHPLRQLEKAESKSLKSSASYNEANHEAEAGDMSHSP